MAAARVIVIYGSETGGSKSKISTIVANWQKPAEMKFSIKGMMEGNDAATKFDTLKDEYDVIILCTSSFGDGDPPSGFENFLGKLYKGAAAGEESPEPARRHAARCSRLWFHGVRHLSELPAPVRSAARVVRKPALCEAR